jgi:hypothetical protein
LPAIPDLNLGSLPPCPQICKIAEYADGRKGCATECVEGFYARDGECVERGGCHLAPCPANADCEDHRTPEDKLTCVATCRTGFRSKENPWVVLDVFFFFFFFFFFFVKCNKKTQN